MLVRVKKRWMKEYKFREEVWLRKRAIITIIIIVTATLERQDTKTPHTHATVQQCYVWN